MTDQTVQLVHPLPVDFDLMRDPLLLRHRLSGDRHFDIDALGDLADALPTGAIEVSQVGAGPVAPDGLDHVGEFVGEAAGDLVRSFEGQRRSLYFYNVERDSAYRDLATMVLGGIVDELGVRADEMDPPEGYVFVSGGAATTSAHLDHECNLLLVLSGSKRVHISQTVDDSVHQALERMHSGGYGTTDSLPADMECFELGPGDGVYIPPLAVHFVENGDELCTAFSVVFRHRRTALEVPVYAINARLRRLGFSPNAPGSRSDPFKRRLHRAAGSVARLRRRATRPIAK